MKNIAPHAGRFPRLRDVVKIYWSIAWRANVLAATIIIIVFSLSPLVFNYLINTGNFDAFRELFFTFLPISEHEALVKHLLPSMIIYTDIWSFTESYFLYFYGFKRVLVLNLYPVILKERMTFKDYNNVFLIPLAIYHFIDFGYFNEVIPLNSIIFALLTTILYYCIILTGLRRMITH